MTTENLRMHCHEMRDCMAYKLMSSPARMDFSKSVKMGKRASLALHMERRCGDVGRR